jgi:hypothetical protein
MHRRFHATGQGFPELIAGAHQPLAMLGAGFMESRCFRYGL